MRPSGPRVRNDPRQQRRPDSSDRNPPSRTPADREQVFASIFGRSAGHHSAAAHHPPPSAHPQGYGYAPNVPTTPGYGLNQDPYRQTGRQPISNGGYEAFAPPLPPPPPPNGSVGMSAGGLGGMRERPAGPMMRAGTDYPRESSREQPSNAYASYPYGVSAEYPDVLFHALTPFVFSLSPIAYVVRRQRLLSMDLRRSPPDHPWDSIRLASLRHSQQSIR